MVFRRSRASRESPPTLTSSLWLPEARVTAGQGACQESQCGGAGARSRQRSRPGPQRRFSHPALLRTRRGLGAEAPWPLSGCRARESTPGGGGTIGRIGVGIWRGDVSGTALTAEGVLQEGVVADGVEGGVEGPVQPAQHGQQQQSGERLQELRDLPRSSGEGWARSPLRRVCPPPLRAAPRPRASPGSSFPRPGWRGRRGR